MDATHGPTAWTGDGTTPGAADVPAGDSPYRPHPLPRGDHDALLAGPDGPQPGRPRRSAGECRRRRAVSAQEVLYREGEDVYHVYLVRRGLVKLVSYLPNGRARILRLHGPGDTVGLEGLLGMPYAHSAVAAVTGEVEAVPVSGLLRLYDHRPAALAELLHEWHGHLAQADRWIADFSTGEIKPRVARLVSFLAELQDGGASGEVTLLRIHEMADILGVTQESVSRVLALFKRDAVLEPKKGDGCRGVYRLDAARLASEARR